MGPTGRCRSDPAQRILFLDLESLRAWGKQYLAPYKVPTLLRVVDDLPRNPMGKIVKPQVAALFAVSSHA